MKKILLISLISISAAVFVLPTSASGPAEITATVTPELISIKIADGYPSSVTYGTLDLGYANAAPIGNPVLRVENNGNIEENFRIRGADAIASGSTWTLAGAQGPKQYIHEFAPVGGSYSVLTKNPSGDFLVNDIAKGSTQDFKLRLSMPSSTDSFGEHSTTVTVIAEFSS